MGVSVSTYMQHENGIRNFPASKAKRYASFFRTTPEWLLYGRRGKDEVAQTNLGPQIPIIGSIAAGVWKESLEYAEASHTYFTGRDNVQSPLRDRFGLRVEGDSMDLLFPPGTILECVNFWGDRDIANNQPVIVQRRRSDGTLETTVKEYVRDKERIEWLVPRSRNPAFQALFRCDDPGPDVEEVVIIATVIASTQFWGT